MTSSLVGSEMCIRDRAFSTAQQSRDLGCHLGCRWEFVRGVGHANLPRAVSYTHLTLPTICSV
eukprot:4999138-Prorocentrum_lima.AAC.1